MTIPNYDVIKCQNCLLKQLKVIKSEYNSGCYGYGEDFYFSIFQLKRNFLHKIC